MSTTSRSYLLVAVQILALFYLFISGPVIPTNILVGILMIGGVMLGLWSVYAFRGTTFKITPELPENATHIISGPYGIIRHPMYASVMLVALALLANFFSFERMIALIILFVNFHMKITHEESLLEKRFGEYKTYKQKTHRLLPFIY